MSKYNRGTVRAVGRGPLATEATPSGKTHEGGAGYARDARSELFLRATGSFAGEDSFYEGAEVRDDRLRDLVAGLATDADGFAWLSGFLPWLRGSRAARCRGASRCSAATKARLTSSRRTTSSCGSPVPFSSESLTGSTQASSGSGGPGIMPGAMGGP